MHTTLRRLIDIATVVADTAAGLDDPARDRRHAEETHDANEEKDDVVPVARVRNVAGILQFGDGGVRPAAKFAGYLKYLRVLLCFGVIETNGRKICSDAKTVFPTTSSQKVK